MKNPIRAYIARIVREEIMAERKERNLKALKAQLDDPESKASQFARRLGEFREQALKDPAPGFNARAFEAYFGSRRGPNPYIKEKS